MDSPTPTRSTHPPLPWSAGAPQGRPGGDAPARFVLDRQHRCAYASPAAERLTGYKLGELRGRPLSLCIHHEHPGWRPYPADECPVTVAIRRNAEAQGEDVLVDRFGNLIPVALTISPIGSGEHPVGFLVEAHDLTAVKRNRLLERTGPEHPGASDG